MAALRRAIYLVPESPLAHFLMGELLLADGRRGEGRRRLEAAVRLLEGRSSDERLAGAEEWTVGMLRQAARTYLDTDSAGSAQRARAGGGSSREV
jgi:hypothetical protein